MELPALGLRVKLKGGEMEFLVSRLDVNTETVDLTPLESGFNVAKSVHFADILDALTGNQFTARSVSNSVAEAPRGELPLPRPGESSREF